MHEPERADAAHGVLLQHHHVKVAERARGREQLAPVGELRRGDGERRARLLQQLVRADRDHRRRDGEVNSEPVRREIASIETKRPTAAIRTLSLPFPETT